MIKVASEGKASSIQEVSGRKHREIVLLGQLRFSSSFDRVRGPCYRDQRYLKLSLGKRPVVAVVCRAKSEEENNLNRQTYTGTSDQEVSMNVRSNRRTMVTDSDQNHDSKGKVWREVEDGAEKVGRSSSIVRREGGKRKHSTSYFGAGSYYVQRIFREAFSRPELVAISMVYLAQGLLGLSRLAVFTLLKDDLGYDPAMVGILTGFTMFPWVIKPLYGFLSDSVPIWGYKRRSYLMLCGALGASSWLTVAGPVVSTPAIISALTLGSLSTACADVVADSIVVELSRGRPQSTAGSLQSLCWASASVGSVLSAYFSGSLVDQYGPKPVFLLTASFPMLVALAAALIPEQRNPPVDKSNSNAKNFVSTVKSQTIALWGAISEKSILFPAIFVFLWQATPTADTAMLYFETNKLGFSTEFLGRIRYVLHRENSRV